MPTRPDRAWRFARCWSRRGRGKATASSCRPFAGGSGAEAAYVEISEEISRHLGDTASPQGIFCICKTLDNRAALDTINRMGRYIALEDMQDPANLGTVVRTAEALGADGLLLSSGCCDLYNPKVLRGSMGGVFRLPFYAVGEMGAAIAALQARGMTGWPAWWIRRRRRCTRRRWGPAASASSATRATA